MKITSAGIYALKIPFVESFSHSLSERDHSDSIVVRVTTESGISGFGEGVARPYVTGETREASVEYIKNELLPWLVGTELDGIDLKCPFENISSLLPQSVAEGAVVWNASRCSVELAVVDCLFRSQGLSVNQALPPASQAVTYSGVIACGTTAKVEKAAERCRAAGFKHVKMKVSRVEDADRVGMVRDILGSSASMRLDANGAFNPNTAVRFLRSVENFDIECIEQPMARGNPADLAALRSSSPIPVMADESIVTIDDAIDLAKWEAVDYFNLRISKCGGIHNTLVISDIARSAGIGIQLGCQVGETAILSAAGRHLAAYLQGLRFVEGSYSTHLLVEDISEENTVLGPAGKTPILTGAGFGITVREAMLDKYAVDTILVS